MRHSDTGIRQLLPESTMRTRRAWLALEDAEYAHQVKFWREADTRKEWWSEREMAEELEGFIARRAEEMARSLVRRLKARP